MQKLFYVSTLIVTMMLLGMAGCGGDEEKPVEPKPEPTTPEPMPPPEGFISSWDVISINDEDPLAFVNADEPDEADRPRINTDDFRYEFAEDGTWTLNVKFELKEFPEDPNRDNPEMAGMLVLTGVWSGTYSINDAVLSMSRVKSDVDIASIPDDFFENVFEVNVIEAKNEILEEFRTHVLNPFAKTRIAIEGETLTLEATGSEKDKMVLEKRK